MEVSALVEIGVLGTEVCRPRRAVMVVGGWEVKPRRPDRAMDSPSIIPKLLLISYEHDRNGL